MVTIRTSPQTKTAYKTLSVNVLTYFFDILEVYRFVLGDLCLLGGMCVTTLKLKVQEAYIDLMTMRYDRSK